MPGQPMTKLFYKIGEVSKLAEVEPYILRYWESEFPMLAPRKNQGGQRVYQDKDLDMVLDIKRMLHEEGYTIAGARKKLAESGRGARVKAAGPGKSPADAAEHGRQSEEAAPPVKDAREPVAPPVNNPPPAQPGAGSGQAGDQPGYLNTPDGLDPVPPHSYATVVGLTAPAPGADGRARRARRRLSESGQVRARGYSYRSRSPPLF